jgi:hypothetical protein
VTQDLQEKQVTQELLVLLERKATQEPQATQDLQEKQVTQELLVLLERKATQEPQESQESQVLQATQEPQDKMVFLVVKPSIWIPSVDQPLLQVSS